MFVPSRVGPSLRNGQPVNSYTAQGLCVCGCHGQGEHPPAVEARLCRECSDERFESWDALIKVLMRDD